MAHRAKLYLPIRRFLVQSLARGQEAQSLAAKTELQQCPLGSYNLDIWSPHSRGFASEPAATSLADQQLSVIAPAGFAGPILRPPVYAIFELGSKQYKVSPGDVIWVERLKNADVGTQIALSRVQVAGSQLETIVGRPYIENASVTAVVEEQVQDAKVIIFKKRRRKHSRRLKGHRQLLTGLRITGVNGIMAPETAKAEVVIG